MTSAVRPKVRQCYPASGHHDWRVVKRNEHGDPVKIRCAHCEQESSGSRNCDYLLPVAGRQKDE